LFSDCTSFNFDDMGTDGVAVGVDGVGKDVDADGVAVGVDGVGKDVDADGVDVPATVDEGVDGILLVILAISFLAGKPFSSSLV
jgi:hypothetical protein